MLCYAMLCCAVLARLRSMRAPRPAAGAPARAPHPRLAPTAAARARPARRSATRARARTCNDIHRRSAHEDAARTCNDIRDIMHRCDTAAEVRSWHVPHRPASRGRLHQVSAQPVARLPQVVEGACDACLQGAQHTTPSPYSLRKGRARASAARQSAYQSSTVRRRASTSARVYATPECSRSWNTPSAS